MSQTPEKKELNKLLKNLQQYIPFLNEFIENNKDYKYIERLEKTRKLFQLDPICFKKKPAKPNIEQLYGAEKAMISLKQRYEYSKAQIDLSNNNQDTKVVSPKRSIAVETIPKKKTLVEDKNSFNREDITEFFSRTLNDNFVAWCQYHEATKRNKPIESAKHKNLLKGSPKPRCKKTPEELALYIISHPETQTHDKSSKNCAAVSKDSADDLCLRANKNLRPWITDQMKPEALKSISICKKMMEQTTLKNLFKCMAYNCSFSTSILCDVERHLESHSNIAGSMQCAYCSVEVEDAIALTSHFATVHKNNRFICKFCFYRSPLVNDQLEHLKKYHPDESIVNGTIDVSVVLGDLGFKTSSQ